MKLSGLARVAKKQLHLGIAQNESGVQYFQIGCAIYPMDGFPYVNDKYELGTLLGLSKAKVDEKYIYRETAIVNHELYGYDIADCIEGDEIQVKRWPMEITYLGETVEPWVSPEGELDLVNTGLLAPIMDEINNGEYIGFFRRTTNDGQNYYVVKSGMYLRAVLMPMKVRRDFIDRMKQIVRMIPEKNIMEEPK